MDINQDQMEVHQKIAEMESLVKVSYEYFDVFQITVKVLTIKPIFKWRDLISLAIRVRNNHYF